MQRLRGPLNAKQQAQRRYAAKPVSRDRERRRQQARYEALTALARRYPAEFMTLYAAELEHAGIAVPQMTRPCVCGRVIHRKSTSGAFPAVCEECRKRERLTNERLCWCGGTIRRKTARSRWPAHCDHCEGKGTDGDQAARQTA
jgi:hypothetical protein